MGGFDESENLAPARSGLTMSPVPILSREAFAAAIGVPVGVVIGWANKGLIPCFPIGKYSLVNIELLRKRCLDKEYL